MNIISNIRFAFRLLVKNPGSSAMAILVMAVGTGVTITMFAFINGILWSPLDLGEEREILGIQWTEQDKRLNSKLIHPLDAKVLKNESQSFEKMTSFRFDAFPFYNPSGERLARRYEIAYVPTDFFDFIGEKPFLGRTFVPEDATTKKTDKCIISYSVWQEHYDANASAIGATAMLNGDAYTVVGVMPPGFRFPEEQYIWIADNWHEAFEQGRESWHRFALLGVLAEGATVAQAKAELDSVAKRLAQEYPTTNERLKAVEIEPYVSSYAEQSNGDSFKTVCYALLFCAFLVLGVASANVFNLVMTRVAKRTAELSIRNAMGASRFHIVMQVVLDGLILTSLGAIGGVLLAGWSLKLVWMKFSQQQYIPYWWNMDLDAKVIGFVVGIVVASALASSLVPGLRASRTSVASNLKDDSRTSSGLFLGALSKTILGFQITVTGVLAFVSVMMLLIWGHLKTRETVYNPDSTLLSTINLHKYVWGDEKGTVIEYLDTFNERVMSIPGVESIAWTSQHSGGVSYGQWYPEPSFFEVDGVVYESDYEKPKATHFQISADYHDIFGIEPLIGRNMAKTDTKETEPVCMVNKAFVDYYWKNENPIGKRIRVPGDVGRFGKEYRTVVGVLPNIMLKPSPGEDLVKGGYLKILVPLSQVAHSDLHVLLRAKGDPRQFVEPMRRVLRDLSPELAFRGNARTLREIVERDMASKDLVFVMFGIFGMASLCWGLWGCMRW